MILNDKQIEEKVVEENMIDPFVEQTENGVVSYGLGHFGYDIRIGNEFHVFTNVPSTPVDPKDFKDGAFVKKEVEDYIEIPPNSFALGHAVERLDMPDDIMGLCVGKSTYARCGIIVNMTPIEAGWRGYLTIEISNSSDVPARVYANEGIAQVVFFRGDEAGMTYDDKAGKYQDQEAGVETSKVVRG